MDRTSDVPPTRISNSVIGYFPSLDGLRALSVFIVIFEHVQMPEAARLSQSALNHFHGWLGVDVFFVLSGFLITGILLREEGRTGSIDMVDFYIRRGFRILPLYLVILTVYIIMLQGPAEMDKWLRMKAALPYFLTFNNDIALLLMPQRVGTTFGLSWTLGIEEKFYLFWPLVCFIFLKLPRTRLRAAGAIYLATLVGTIFSFPMGRAYGGLVVGAILSIIVSSNEFQPLKDTISKIPSVCVVAVLIIAFALVDYDKRLVFVFSWAIALMVANLISKASGLSKALAHPVLVWFGKRSYAMYLIQGFAIRGAELVLKPSSVFDEISITLGAFGLASVGAAFLHKFIEEPARKLGRAISARRSQPQSVVGYSTD